ncbi:MAG: VWA-like domain-containing protein [Bacteroidales bacterium]|nr:VWA-like domain-containing protein [Lachnoclostridium sp.]MCM1383700.1 VWA-like domain-containing protein [Lachnoclostridium sp.]MCM1464328.1 VWA-like domain-containing protein [Bacteroidales bacterium]
MPAKMTEEQKKISALAKQMLKLAHDDILVHLRFFDRALGELVWAERPHTDCFATDGKNCYYDPLFVLRSYQEDPKSVARSYLHLLLHCIFSHSFQYDKLETDLWDLAADIAVENVILELRLPSVALEQDEAMLRKLRILQEDAGGLTAERIYRYFRNSPPTENEREELNKLFCRDVHTLWKPKEELEMTMEQWKKISERIKAELKSFTKARTGAETLEKNLEETTRERYDYSEILRRFTVTGEDITVNDEEFDAIYYTYGLQHYGNLPLIEPLEYKEVHKVKEFVIALDTSASCRGAIVKAFLQKTYSILKGSENFFHKINVHIIQCDSEVQSDTKITGDEDFEKFMQYGKLNGFGATDFRPVFDYIDELKTRGEFENLKGLIYFTDGYGIYPERMPDYDVIFAFLDEDDNRAPVPPWSMKVVLESEGLEEEQREVS